MVDQERIYEAALAKGSEGMITTDRSDLSKPIIFRGITKRKHINAASSIGRDYYYIDTGYFGNYRSPGNPSGKKNWHRVVHNELQKSCSENVPSDRWDNLVKDDPRLKWPGWKTKGNKILLVLPNPKSCHFYGLELDTWMKSTIENIKKYSNMPIVVRKKGSRSQRNEHSIYDELDDGVFATVTLASIAAIESIAYGIPAFVSVPCAAWPIANKDLSRLKNPIYFDEKLVQQHCYTLAYGQFTYNELENGTAYKLLQKVKKK